MHESLKQRICQALTPKPARNLAEWGEAEIVIPSSYQTPREYKAAIDSLWSLEHFAFWREPLAVLSLDESTVVVVLKASQVGFSQNLALPLCLKGLSDGSPSIYATAQQIQAEQFLLERIKPLVRASPCFHSLEVRERDSELYTSNGGLLTTIHNTSKGGVKTRPARIIVCDELDIWAVNTLDKLRSRTLHFRDSKILIGSAPDADAKRVRVGEKFLTPIFAEWETSSQGFYFLTQPQENAKPFKLEFGFSKGRERPSHGLIWNASAKRKDGTWNEEEVRSSCRYVTPEGVEISTKEKDFLVQSGKWIHTFPERRKKGYHVNTLYVFRRDVADVAVEYLEAKRKGGLSFRTWLLENFAEDLEEERIEIADRSLRNLSSSFKRGESFAISEKYKSLCDGKPVKTILGVDVQNSANGIWYLAADFCSDHIAVKEWGNVGTFADIDKISRALNCNHVAVDCGYPVRRSETYDACMQYQFVPVMGRPKENFGQLWEKQNIDPYEGKRGGGKAPLAQILFQDFTIKYALFEAMTGLSHTKLLLPSNIDEDLERHLTAEVLNGTQFVERHSDNHLLDCLKYAFLLAKFMRYLPQ